MLIAVLVVLAAVLSVYTVWKLDQEWQITQQCFCGHNIDALFSTRDEYLQLRLLGVALEIMAVVAGVGLLAVFRPLSVVIFGFLVGILCMPSSHSNHLKSHLSI